MVYGESYPSWKKKHQKPATPEQLARFEQTKPWHAKHAKVVENVAASSTTTTTTATTTTATTAAEPCCYDDDGLQEAAPQSSVRVRLGARTSVSI